MIRSNFSMIKSMISVTRLLVISLTWLTTVSAVAQSDNVTTLNGRIIDEDDHPMAFANIILLARADSSFLQGVISAEDGTFTMPDAETDAILRISSVGYITRHIDYHGGRMGDIRMQADNQVIGEVVVRGAIPSYKMTAEGITTNVENTLLSKLGTAEDVLGRIPGIVRKQGGFEVFGKGEPLVYINGRQMRDASELDRLKSEDIKSVELITAPGARYDATVKAVVKIRTKAMQGEGFGFDVRSSYYQSENTDLTEQLDWNYRHNRFDVFGTIQYTLNQTWSHSPTVTTVQTDTLWAQKFDQGYNAKNQAIQNTFGTNYAFSDENSAGLRYTLTLQPDGHQTAWLASDITANGIYFDRVSNNYSQTSHHRPSHLLNAYYRGKIGKMGIDFNADYLYNRQSDRSNYNEQSESSSDRIVTSENNMHNELFAAKLTADYLLYGGSLTTGAEYTQTHRNDDYINPEQYVPTSFTELKESHTAAFVEYARQLVFGRLTAGLRYEWVDFNYYENDMRLDAQSRSFGNLFPNLSFGTQIGKVQMQAGYAARTRRPSYRQLSNNVLYGNRFLMQSGNPFLKHEYIHDLSLTGTWKFLQASVGYTDRRDAIIFWAEQQEGSTAVSRITYTNLPTLKSISAQVAAAPKFGAWSPQVSASVRKQWLTLDTEIATYRMNKPVWQFGFSNIFDCGHGWTASADGWMLTKGHEENNRFTRNFGAVNIGLTKSMLKDCLSIQLQGTDIFHTVKSANDLYAGRMHTAQSSEYDSRQFVLTLRYKFNTTRSKYKGTGAGNAEKNRL